MSSQNSQQSTNRVKATGDHFAGKMAEATKGRYTVEDAQKDANEIEEILKKDVEKVIATDRIAF